jgi:P2-related tail formation protein
LPGTKKPGIDEAFIAEYETTLTSVKALNQAQEKLKADLKSKTEELEKKLQTGKTSIRN